MFEKFLDMRGKRGPLGFLASFVAISALGSLLVILIDRALHANHHLSGIIVFLAILVAVFCFSVLLTQAVKRVNDMGRAGILALTCIFPSVCVPMFWFYSPAAVFGSGLLIVFLLGLFSLGLLMMPGRGAPPQLGNP